MWDPNEAFENDDENYNPIDDDLEFDNHFLDNMSFNEVVEFLDNMSEMFNRYTINNIKNEKRNWYKEYYNNPNQEIIIDVDAGLFEDVENLVDNFSIKKYNKLAQQYRKKDQEDEFIKVCEISGVFDLFMENVNSVEDIING